MSEGHDLQLLSSYCVPPVWRPLFRVAFVCVCVCVCVLVYGDAVAVVSGGALLSSRSVFCLGPKSINITTRCMNV